MTPVDETAAAAGKPLLMHTIGEPASPGAVVARWRHDGAELDISPSDVVRVTIGLQDGVPVRQGLGTAGQRPHVAALGGITVTPARIGRCYGAIADLSSTPKRYEPTRRGENEFEPWRLRAAASNAGANSRTALRVDDCRGPQSRLR